RDLDSAVGQVGRDRRDRPGRAPRVSCFGEKIGKLTGRKAALALGAAREELLAARFEGAGERGEEAVRVRRQDFGETRFERRALGRGGRASNLAAVVGGVRGWSAGSPGRPG